MTSLLPVYLLASFGTIRNNLTSLASLRRLVLTDVTCRHRRICHSGLYLPRHFLRFPSVKLLFSRFGPWAIVSEREGPIVQVMPARRNWVFKVLTVVSPGHVSIPYSIRPEGVQDMRRGTPLRGWKGPITGGTVNPPVTPLPLTASGTHSVPARLNPKVRSAVL